MDINEKWDKFKQKLDELVGEMESALETVGGGGQGGDPDEDD